MYILQLSCLVLFINMDIVWTNSFSSRNCGRTVASTLACWPGGHWFNLSSKRNWKQLTGLWLTEAKMVKVAGMIMSTSPIRCRVVYKSVGASFTQWYCPLHLSSAGWSVKVWVLGILNDIVHITHEVLSGSYTKWCCPHHPSNASWSVKYGC